MPLSQWFPVRYLASHSRSGAHGLVQRPGDGITYRYKSRAVDVPMIATLSEIEPGWLPVFRVRPSMYGAIRGAYLPARRSTGPGSRPTATQNMR